MKKVKIKKLVLNKTTIAKLSDENLSAIKGGSAVTNNGTCVNCGGSYVAACKTKQHPCPIG